MPTYAYRCKRCEHQFETIQKMSDKPLTQCPECNGEIARVLFPIGVVFKGSGFHVNDYPSSSLSTSVSSDKKESKAEAKTEKETAAASKN